MPSHRFVTDRVALIAMLTFVVASPSPAAAQSDHLPAGWKPANPSFAGMYRVESDTTVRRSGVASGHIAALTANANGVAGLAQMIRPEGLRGKRVRFSVWLTSRGTEYPPIVYIRADAADRPVDDATSFTLRSRPGVWTQVSVVLDVPANADELLVRVMLMRSGELWVDDALIDTVGASVSAMNTHRPLPYLTNNQVKAWWGPLPNHLFNPGFEPATNSPSSSPRR